MCTSMIISMRVRGAVKTILLYTHYIPGKILFPVCWWAGLKSVTLPKIKPQTGLHAGWYMQSWSLPVGKYLLLQPWQLAVLLKSLWVLPRERNKIQCLTLLDPISDLKSFLQLLQEVPDSKVVVGTSLFTWCQSGSTHGWGIRRSSRHRQVVIHLFNLENTAILCVYGTASPCVCSQRVSLMRNT